MLLSCYLFPVVLVLITMPTWIFTQEFMCCSQATGFCKSVCEKISLVELATDSSAKNQTLLEITKFCSTQMVAFWECFNATFKEISRGQHYPGRLCCKLPQSETCKRACVTSSSKHDLQTCRRSDEIEFFSCVERQAEGETCCSQARSFDCKNACWDVFKSRLTPTRQQRNSVQEMCEFSSPRVLGCVGNFTRVTPAGDLRKYGQCCERSNKSKCRETCKVALQTSKTHQEAYDVIQLGDCGVPSFEDQFWQCFIKSEDDFSTQVEVSRIERVGMDSAKLHCCQKASSPICKRLCSKTFGKYWSTTWSQFYYKCLTQASEESLRNCIDEVEEPCELGCDGLNFCTNFNNRPTELFRSCTPEADKAARNDVLMWQTQNDLTLLGFALPLNNITKCSPNTWKAVACTLQIKPCNRHTHSNHICLDACLKILTDCVDWSRVPLEHSPESICSALSPPGDACVSLTDYLDPAGLAVVEERVVSSPCKGEPCDSNKVCAISRNCLNCLPYTCEPACKLGEVSEYAVPDGTYVRLPIPNNPKGCLQVCRCNNGRIDECRALECIPLKPCAIGNDQYKEHGLIYTDECNTCSCYAEEIVCTKRKCENGTLIGKDTAYTTLPCNYPAQYIPACGRNGNTYPSYYLAKCAGLNDSDIQRGPCPDPCKTNPCPMGHKCVPNQQVCLSLNQKPCVQYLCVNGTTNCHDFPKRPVCDTENHDHQNACFLAHHNARYAYAGPCLNHCKHAGTVCGINGRTYVSECAAWSDFITVDYPGPCVTVGAITDQNTRQCKTVKCQPVPKCIGITPPGACCPTCAGAVKFLYSHAQVDRALYALQNASSELTLQTLLKDLQRHVQVAECVLRGFLSVEADVFVLVQSTEKQPSDMQQEACVREAEKLVVLVNNRSPRIVSELSLSCLTAGVVVHSVRTNEHVSTGSRQSLVGFWVVIVVLCLRFMVN